MVGEAKTAGNVSRRLCVLASKKGLEESGTVLGDEVMAAALIERILHHCHIVNIRGFSHRVRAHQDLLSGPGRTTRAEAAWHEPRRTPAGRVLGAAVLRGSDGASGRLGVAISVGHGQAERARRQRSSPAWAETAPRARFAAGGTWRRPFGSEVEAANRARPKAAPQRGRPVSVVGRDAGGNPRSCSCLGEGFAREAVDVRPGGPVSGAMRLRQWPPRATEESWSEGQTASGDSR